MIRSLPVRPCVVYYLAVRALSQCLNKSSLHDALLYYPPRINTPVQVKLLKCFDPLIGTINLRVFE